MRSQSRPSPNATAAADAERQSTSQFPEIERLVETEDFDRINKSFTAAYEELERLTKAKGGMGKSRDAKKAMKAIERVMDLLRELLKVKYQIQEGGKVGS
ncbi:MAG TPA: hypothetical protein VLJ37_02425 [bacterium]|nr:hypothetical protein [bacterium]